MPDPPHGASLFHKRPRQDRRDSGVSAAMCGRAGGSIISAPPPPHGASLFPERPGQDQRDGCVSAAVWEGTGNRTQHPFTGRHYPRDRPGWTGGPRVSPPLCGEMLEV